MKVLQLISSRGFFGAENVLIELSAQLKALGDSVTVGAFSNQHTDGAGSSELAEHARARGLKAELFKCKGRVDLKTVAAICRFVKDNGVDVIHSHGYKSNIYACLANRKVKSKLVTTCHNWINADSKMSFYTRLDKFFLRRFDAVVAVSDEVSDQLLKAGVEPGKLKVIGNGIDLEKFRKPASGINNVKAELGIPANAKVIGAVGRLSPEKGYFFLLEAARDILSKKEDCFFLLVGDGQQRQDLKEQAKRFGIEKRVIFAGKRKDIPEALSAMDIFVMSSLTEGQPMALLEAMAAKRPIVATSVGDMPKLLKAGAAGLIVPPSDSSSLAAGILRLLGDPAHAASLSAVASRTVAENYSSIRMAAEYRACYKG